jgi:hypothetical protein
LEVKITGRRHCRRPVLFAVFIVSALDKIVVIDKSAANTNMTRLRRRCDKSERLVWSAPNGHWKVLTMIRAMTVRGVCAAVTVDAATDGGIFRRFVIRALAPSLRPGDWPVMDNLGPQGIGRAGARALCLPP